MSLTLEDALARDAADPLAPFRQRFHLPKGPDGAPLIYLTGNSLGLQPVETRAEVLSVLDDWAELGVEGHFKARDRWVDYHRPIADRMAPLVGAHPHEVTVMNSLTVNLHLLMAAFYRPTANRFKIIIEEHAFPSDRYAVRSHLAWHNLDPDAALIFAEPTPDAVAAHLDAENVALVLLGGVNYASGQWLDMERITQITRDAGAVMGWDLAHAAGNVPLHLHDWNVDFAAWCSYKYLNAGPGGPSGVFVHERNAAQSGLTGWWGHDLEDRFAMPDAFRAARGADRFQLSNPSILGLAGLNASLTAFDEAGMAALRAKSVALTAFMEALVTERLPAEVQILTPSHPDRRGAQLSLRVNGGRGRQVFDRLEANGVVCDWREPDIIRAAPVPLYNSFRDAYVFVERLTDAIHAES